MCLICVLHVVLLVDLEHVATGDGRGHVAAAQGVHGLVDGVPVGVVDELGVVEGAGLAVKGELEEAAEVVDDDVVDFGDGLDGSGRHVVVPDLEDVGDEVVHVLVGHVDVHVSSPRGRRFRGGRCVWA